MKNKLLFIILFLLLAATIMTGSGCRVAHANDTAREAPPIVKIVPGVDIALFAVDHPDQFPLAEATEHPTSPELVVTGAVSPDVSRSVPVVSLASGRVVAIHARLGDTVKAGQVLLSIRSDDVGSGFSDYRKAVRDEALARTQLTRARDLNEHGALSLADLQTAEDTEDKARIDVETTEEHLRLLGNDPRNRMALSISSRPYRE
jgi:cobalt-zinc-cadmium efflux system membrane fusion protein